MFSENFAEFGTGRW